MSQDLPPLSPRLQALEAIDARTRRNRRLAVAGGLLVILAAVVAGYFVYRTWLYQVKLGGDLRRDLAFRHETPTIMSGSEREEVFALYPEVGGAMDRAGVEKGDIVVSMSVTEFYRLAANSRGLAFGFSVIEGGNGVPLAHRKPRLVILPVPR